MQIDTTFLKVHPRTALWWQQREQCERCVHSTTKPIAVSGRGGASYGGGMNCAEVARWDRSCITAREEGQECGPDARLFVARRDADGC